MFLYPTFFSPFCYISPLCTIFKTPGSFASVWTIFPAPSWHREKCHCTTYMGLMVQTFLWNEDQLEPGYELHFHSEFLQWKKHAQQPFSKPHCFVNVENNSLGDPWYDYGGSFPPSLVTLYTLYGFEAACFGYKSEHLHEHVWTHLSNLQYPTTKTPFWQTVIQHGKTSATQG